MHDNVYVSVLIPARNEAGNLAPLLQEVRNALAGEAYEVIVVDDGWFYVACAAMGLGVISKGVGFLPALMLIPCAWAVHAGWSGVTRMPGRACAGPSGSPRRWRQHRCGCCRWS